MIVKKSSIIGYCYGVSNTVRLAEEAVQLAKEKGLPCYSLGKLIHNNDVVSYFEKKGLKTIKTPKYNNPGVALIRAHGIKDCDRRAFENANFLLIDSTCPTVLKAANALRWAAKEGKKVIILGYDGHAETLGLQGVEVEKGVLAKSFLVTCMEDAKELLQSDKIKPEEEVFVVTQTTFSKEDYNNITEFLKTRYKNIGFGNRPCAFCEKRELEGLALACQCDCVVVVGGRNSSNTKNLALVAEKSGKPVFLVENAAGIDQDLVQKLKKFETVAVLSGSSTPMDEIERVEQVLQAI